MAKTKRSKKSKNQILEEKLRLRIIILFVIFAIIVSALRLGFIGQGIHNCVAFLTGNLYGVVYLALLVVCIYILCKAQIPRLNGPEAIGIYAIFISVLTIASIPSQPQASGMGVISTYLQSQQMNKGGFIGICLYGVFSSLFESLGTLILSIIILIIGLVLIFSKLYFQHQKTKKKKPKVSKQEEAPIQTIVLKKKSHFFDFLSKDKEIPLFPDSAFDDVEEKIDPEITSAFEFDQDNMKLDIKEKKPLKIKEEKESPQESYIEPPKKTDLSHYQLPPLSLLSTRSTHNVSKEKSAANKNAARLTNVLKQFGVNATIENAFIGPTITKYELKLEIGTRVNKILQLQDDIKLALATADIRIEAPIPGKPYVGIEVPNQSAAMVGFKDVLKSLLSTSKYQHNPLVVALGKDVSGKPVFTQLDKMPHLLIAGATGSGKSVCVNTIISSILMRAKPDEVKLILVDPKKVELSIYNGIPHLLAPVVTDPKKAAAVLREVVAEMERRYDLFASVNARNIQGYNEFAKTYNEDHTDEPKEILPYHVIILDEVADLMMVVSKDVEDCIMRISQMARAAGIHLIVATQRPSTDIITGVIKANIPSRIAFAVSSSIDSRTILDTSGAEKLLGKGDMLFSPMGSSSPMRVQGCFVSDEEVSAIVHYVSSQQEAVYEDKYVNVKSISSTQGSDDFDEEDEEYEKCREFVIQAQKASTSLLQRKFRIGYNKAARIIDRLEEEGVIGPQLGSKPREVYIRQYHEEDL